MQDYKKRIITSSIVLAVFFTLFFFRIFYLQIIKGDEYERFSRENSLRLLNIPAPRGEIFDRHGKKLVVNRPSFDIIIFPREVKDSKKIARELSKILNLSKQELNSKIQKVISYNYHKPTVIIKDINRNQLAQIESKKNTLSGLDIEVNYQRIYPQGNTASHILGYIGLVTKQELENNPDLKSYQQVGKLGIEKKLDVLLKGTEGLKYLAVDALGRKVSTDILQQKIENKKSISGQDIRLSIDIELQKIAEKLISGEKGAIIVLDINNGEVLALASQPSFNIENFAFGITTEEWNLITKDESFSMLNRATQGTYPPGSVLKIVTAFAALKEKIIDSNTQVYCKGFHKIGNRKFHCWKRYGHGWTNLHKSLVESCDVYYYHIADMLGIDKLSKYLAMFGFGKKTGIELSEKQGISPTREWKLNRFKKPWYPGETAVTSIGQGYISVTPLQVAIMTSSIANGGKLLTPTLIKYSFNNNGKNTKSNQNKVSDLPMSKYVNSVLKKALYDAVNNFNGTGATARSEHISISGKTGTAQVVSLKTKKSSKKYFDHAWFTSFAPSDNPEISITVLVENGGNGSEAAAPLAKILAEEYYKIQNKRNDI